MEGSLLKVTLPQTLADAIDVTREIGIEFIWIDALSSAPANLIANHFTG